MTLDPAKLNGLRQILVASYDKTNLGWGIGQKFLDWDTLGAQLHLLDPA
jgi:hypothetical protein